jgi:NADH-quinone oxidoreductase subunit G
VKADVDFGPTLMLNRNRCILHAPRASAQVDGDADQHHRSRLRQRDRHLSGRRRPLILSGNLMDVCPVGAITTRDYRFKSRPWDNLNAADTICTLCEKGCNVTAWIKAKPEWAKGCGDSLHAAFQSGGERLCATSRLQYHWIEGDDRSASCSNGAAMEPRH